MTPDNLHGMAAIIGYVYLAVMAAYLLGLRHGKRGK